MGHHDPGEPLSPRRRAPRTATWVVLGVVVLIGAIATTAAWIQELRSAHSREQAALATASAAVNDAAGTAAAALGGGAALVEPDGRIATDRLTTFSSDVAEVSSLQAVGVIEVVPPAARAEVEARLGNPLFRLTEDGVAPVQDGGDHWVVTRVVPDDHLTAALVGLDVLSNPVSAEAATEAANSGVPSITEPVVLPADLARQLGAGDEPLTMLFVLKPLFAPPPDDADDGERGPLRGFLVSALTGTQVEAQVEARLPEGVRARVVDEDVAVAVAGPTEFAGDAGRDVDVMSRTWRVEVADDRPANHAFSALIAGVTLALLAVLGVVIVRERRRQDQLRRVDAAVRGTAALARGLSAATGQAEVVRTIEAELPRLVGAEHAAVLMVDRDGGRLRPHDWSGSERSWPSDAPAVRRALEGEVVLLRSLLRGNDQLDPALVESLRGEGTRAVALLPVATQNLEIDMVVAVTWSGPQGDDPVVGSNLATVDEICEQALARADTTDRSTRQAGALASLAEELARCDTVDEVCEAVLRGGRQPVDASAISMGLIDPTRRRLQVHHGDTVAPGITHRYAEPALDEDLAFTEAARTGEPVLIETFDEYRRRYPGTDASNASMGAGARAALPLAVGDELIGSIAVAWAEDRPFDEATMFSLSTIAELAAQAVHRARLVGVHRIDAERSRQLAGVARRLAVEQEGPPLTRFVVDEAVAVVGADLAALVVVDTIGWPPAVSRALDDHPELSRLVAGSEGAPGAIASAVVSGDDEQGRSSELARAASAAGVATSATLALRDRDGQPLGGLWLGWRHRRDLDDDLRDVIATLVGMTAQSVARCQLTDQLRADADRNERLATFARRLANVTDVDQLCRIVIDDGGRTVGAVVANVGLVDDTGERLLVTPNTFFPAQDRARFADRQMDDHLPGVECVRSKQPVLLHTLDEVREHYPGRVAETMEANGLHASAHFPLLDAEGSAIGCIGFAWPHDQPFRPVKLARLRTIAELCTQTLERARLADAEHRLVDSIHRRVVGRTPPAEHLAVATRYLPATEEIGMGGDWYDALVLDDHRYAVIVGDVTGHGIGAVADMIELRAAIRTLLLNGVPAEQVFTQVSSSWLDSTASLATACISVVDTEQGTLQHVSAGHIPALVRTPAGDVVAIEGGRQPLLGVPGRVRAPHVVPFPSGSTVVMCSDGLIERRDRTIDESIDTLVRVLEESDVALGGVEQLADLILERCLTREEHADDVALVVLSMLPAGISRGDASAHPAAAAPDGPVRERTFAASLDAIAEAREFVRSAADPGHDDLALATSELVTNAVLHGRGPVTVRLHPVEGGVRLAVHDHGESLPRHETPELHAVRGRGLGIVDSMALSWGAEADGQGKWVWAVLPSPRPVRQS